MPVKIIKKEDSVMEGMCQFCDTSIECLKSDTAKENRGHGLIFTVDCPSCQKTIYTRVKAQGMMVGGYGSPTNEKIEGNVIELSREDNAHGKE